MYNIGSGQATSVNEIFRHLARLTGYAGPEHHGPAKPGEVRTTYLDASRAGRELGWAASVPLAEGLRRTVAYFRDPPRA